MSIFDLFFLASALASIVTLLAALISAIRARGRTAAKILKLWAAYATVYMIVALAYDFLAPQRIIQVGEPWCLDDWCLTAEAVNANQAQSVTTYKIDLRISSRARRVSQRAAGAWIYLINVNNGQLVPPDSDASAVPLDVRLQPLQEVTTSRVFHVPSQAVNLGLITGHGGPYCSAMSLLIIGEGGCLFKKPTMIRIAPPGVH